MPEQTPNIGGTTPRTERLQTLVDRLDVALDEIDPDRQLRVIAHIEVTDLDTAITYSRGFSPRESLDSLVEAINELIPHADQECS